MCGVVVGNAAGFGSVDGVGLPLLVFLGDLGGVRGWWVLCLLSGLWLGGAAGLFWISDAFGCVWFWILVVGSVVLIFVGLV